MNPVSGRGRAARLAAAVADRLGAEASVQVHAGASEAESAQLLTAVAGTCEAVVVLGGDGMVHLAVQALAGGDVPLGIVPAGTGNDTADVLGLPPDPLRAVDAVLAALAAQSVRRLDLGRTSVPGAPDRWWVSVLCAGFDSAVTSTANRLRWPRGPRRYDVAILAELLRFAPRPFALELDGSTVELEATLVAIGNGPQYGGGKKITSGARMDDGTFLVTLVEAVSRRELVRMAPSLGDASHLSHPAVRQLAARSVRLAAPDTFGYADGERIAPLPLTSVCVPAALPVLVPPGP